MRITCPECATVLKPANPLAAGKKVRCPKCGTTFSVPELDTPGARNRVAAPPAGALRKRMEDEPNPLPKPAAKPTTQAAPKPEPNQAPGQSHRQMDDDEGPATYNFIDPVGLAEEDKKDEPEISYAPDTSIKDLRGPATEALIQPTNFMLALCIAGFFGWLALLLIYLIPVVFPIDSDEGDKANPKPVLRIDHGFGVFAEEFLPPPPQGGDSDAKKKDDAVAFGIVLGVDLAAAAMYGLVLFFVIVVLPIVLGMAYTGVQTYGAVKSQNLESRPWGLVSSIMSLIPINLLGLGMAFIMLVSWGLAMFLDDDDMTFWIVIVVCVLIALGQIGVGVWNLLTLMREDVIDGFEYVPDTDDVKVKKPRKKRQS